MKKFSKKSVLLFAGAMAICAFVLPAAASASSWGPVGSHHTLDSGNTGFSSTLAGAATNSSCSNSSFTTVVRNAQDMQITAATFGGLCTANSAVIGTCTVTTQATGLPWTATAVTTSNLQIHGVNIDLIFEQRPTVGGCSAAAVGQKLQITGTLTGGRYLGVGQISIDNAQGLVSHSVAFGNNSPITALGTLSDTQGTLTVTG